MEKLPPFERPEPRVVGRASSKEKKEVKIDILDKFGEGHFRQLSKEQLEAVRFLEYPKQHHEKAAIRRANEVVNQLMRNAGVQPFDVPERNVHILPQHKYDAVIENPTPLAITDHDSQSIVINADRTTFALHRVSVLLHEIIHLKSHLALEAWKEKGGKLDYGPHRLGLEVHATKKKSVELGGRTVYFKGLDEGIVAEIEKRYWPRIVESDPYLEEKYAEQLKPKNRRRKAKLAKKKNIPEDEIILVTEDDDLEIFPYLHQRRVLGYLVDSIYEDNKKKFDSRDDVMNLFINSIFNGQLLPIARLVEGSFGEGSFREVGGMDDDSESARRLLVRLRKLRRKRSSRG